MEIDCFTTEKTRSAQIIHDLILSPESPEYTNEYTVSFKNPSQALQEKLRETGPLPNDRDRANKKKSLGGAGGRKSGAQKHDYDKLAQAVEKLEEDDLLRVIQLMNDNKSPDTFIKADVDSELTLFSPFSQSISRKFSPPSPYPPIFLLCSVLLTCGLFYFGLIADDLLEAGEFSIDLYTMPDLLTNKIWDYLVS